MTGRSVVHQKGSNFRVVKKGGSLTLWCHGGAFYGEGRVLW